jgi:hypothetical protein
LSNKDQNTDNTSGAPTVSIKVFQWFEKMKNNYDQNIQQILSQFEKIIRGTADTFRVFKC